MFKYNFYCIGKLFFEITHCNSKERFKCTFYDGSLKLYEAILGTNEWMSTDSRKYIGNYFVHVESLSTGKITIISFLEHLKGKRIYISFGSSSLGDTIAWMPYCLEFQNKYECKVIVSTFKNYLFDYPELEFVKPGDIVNNIVAMPEIGWHWDYTKEPENPATVPLQKAATNILHLDYVEIRPKLVKNQTRVIEEKYVCISTKSTSQCKHWYYWKELIIELKKLGYRVIELSQDADDFGAEYIEDKSLNNVMNYLKYCDFYIGLSSGISWLAWAMNVKVYMISNFTENNHEFECIRIDNRNVCNGCWNNPKFKFDKGNWWYCPEHEDTPRQFECHKSISCSDVLKKLDTGHS